MKKRDNVTVERIKTLHPALREEALKIYDEANEQLHERVILRYAYTKRSQKEQTDLYALGRTVINPNGKSDKKPFGNIVTKAQWWQTFHFYGMAVDIVLLIDRDGNGTFEEPSWSEKLDFDKDGLADWSEVVKVFKKYGWNWGGVWEFRDAPHFEKTFGYTWQLLNKLYNEKRFISGTDYIFI